MSYDIMLPQLRVTRACKYRLDCMSLNLSQSPQMLWGFSVNEPDVPAHCKYNPQNFIYTLIRCLKVSKLDWMRSAEIFQGGEVLFADNEPDVVPQWPRCINRFLVTLGKTAPSRNWPNTKSGRIHREESTAQETSTKLWNCFCVDRWKLSKMS